MRGCGRTKRPLFAPSQLIRAYTLEHRQVYRVDIPLPIGLLGFDMSILGKEVHRFLGRL
jgi:hypothetical protein